MNIKNTDFERARIGRLSCLIFILLIFFFFNLGIFVVMSENAEDNLKITIVSPENKIYSESEIEFALSLNKPGNCGFSLDNVSFTKMNEVNPTYFNYTKKLGTGKHDVIFKCSDMFGNTTLLNREFSVDTTAPVINLISPNEDDSVSSPLIFRFDVLDTNIVRNCSLFLDGYVISIKSDINQSYTNSFTSSARLGKHKWQIKCVDSVNNVGSSSIRSLNVSSINLPSLAGRIGKIDVSRTPFWNCSKWSKCIDGFVKRNCVPENEYANETNKPVTELYCEEGIYVDYYPREKLEIITPSGSLVDFYLYGEDLDDGTLLKAAWYVNSQLMKEDYSYGIMNSPYSHRFYKTDGEKFFVEVEISKLDYEKKIVWEVNVTDEEIEKCEEKWICEWTECNEFGYKYAKSCIDLNECGIEISKPHRMRCDCVERLNCTDWSECKVSYGFEEKNPDVLVVEGRKQRRCIDMNDCQDMVIQERKCTIRSSIETKKAEWCNEPYIEVYDTEEGRLIARLKEEEIHDINVLDMEFLLTDSRRYCRYCYNGVRDEDEEGIDCGGSCQPCKEIGELKEPFFSIENFYNLLLRFWLFIILFVLFMLLAFLSSRIKEVMKMAKESVQLRKSYGLISRKLRVSEEGQN